MTGSVARLHGREPTNRESQVLDYLASHGGVQPARIAVALGIPTGGYILMLLVRLERQGLVTFAPHVSPPRLTHRGFERSRGGTSK